MTFAYTLRREAFFFLMRLFLVILLLFSWSQNPTPRNISKPEQQQSSARQELAKTDQRGTEQSPLVVKTIESTKTQAETEQDAEARKEKSANDRRVLGITIALAVIAFLQLLVYAYQAKKLRETVESAGEQSKAMERHIGEAARSADAMENIASKIEMGNKAIMRAYLTVNIGSGTYQERNNVGQPDIKFAVSPTVANTGNTHARKVIIRKKAAIFRLPLPDNFAYEQLGPETEVPFATVAAHQSYTITAIVDDFVPDAEVALIKEANGKALHMWGTITYEDIFGDTHTTKFGQSIVFAPPNQIVGWYTPGQNDAD